MLIHQDNLKRGFEPVGSRVVMGGDALPVLRDGGQCACKAEDGSSLPKLLARCFLVGIQPSQRSKKRRRQSVFQ